MDTGVGVSCYVVMQYEMDFTVNFSARRIILYGFIDAMRVFLVPFRFSFTCCYDEAKQQLHPMT